jgi:hypothetical protein
VPPAGGAGLAELRLLRRGAGRSWFARDRGDLMPRIFAVSHDPEIVDRFRQVAHETQAG